MDSNCRLGVIHMVVRMLIVTGSFGFPDKSIKSWDNPRIYFKLMELKKPESVMAVFYLRILAGNSSTMVFGFSST